jgi:hypothetical protein
LLNLNIPAHYLISGLICGATKTLQLEGALRSKLPVLPFEELQKLKQYTRTLKLDLLFELGTQGSISALSKETALMKSMVQQQLAETLQKNLTDAAIRFVFVKGIASDARYWHQSGLRSYADVDVWVHPDDFTACECTILNLGYSQKAVAPPAARPKSVTAKSYKKALKMGDAVIDLHRMPFDGFREPTPWDNVWPRVQKIQTPVGERMVLSPEDEIVFLAGNQLQALFAQWPKACLDIFVLIQKENIDWVRLATKAKEAKVSTALWALCAALIEFKTPLPDTFMSTLMPKRRIQEQLEHFFNAIQKKPSNFKQYIHRIYWILILTEDFSSLRRYFLQWLPQRVFDKIS